jgi:hypothetical protein
MVQKHTTSATTPETMTAAEISQLAERLQSRADQIENLGTQDLVRDLRLMAKVVRALLRSFNGGDAVKLD